MPLCESNKAVISDGNQDSPVLDLMDGKLLKEDVFPCLSRAGDGFRLFLTSTELLLQSLKQAHFIERFQLEDLFGVHIMKHKKLKTETAAYLCFYLYPKSKRLGLLSSVKCREKIPLVFLVQKPGLSFAENLDYASTWKEETLKLLRNKFPKWQKQASSSSNQRLNNISNDESTNTSNNTAAKLAQSSSISVFSPHQSQSDGKSKSINKHGAELSIALASFQLFQRRFLVIINPKSGQAKTISIYRTQVAPILQEAGIKAEILITQKAGHAHSFVSHDLNFNDIHGIVTVGGDGLLFEVVNGLRLRPDAAQIAGIPVGVIAGGSGNGLARSIAAYSGESLDYIKNPVLSTALAVARGKVLPVNIQEVELDDKKMFSFLSAGWGLLADIDVESEILRIIGEPRFTLWSFLRLVKLNKYKARLSYIPSSDKLHPNPSDSNPNPSGVVEVESDFLCVYSACQSYIGSDLIFAPKATANDGVIHLTYLRGDAGRFSATQFLLSLDKGTHVNVSGVTYETVREFTIHSPGGIGGNLVIDGEKFAGEKLTVRICPRPLNVFTL